MKLRFTQVLILSMSVFMLYGQTFSDQTSQISTAFTSSQPVGVVDINSDGRDDIVRMNSSVLQIQYQQANGSFIQAQIPSKYFPWGLCVADIDRNGFNDVIYGGQNEGGSSIQAVMMDASGQPDISVDVPAAIFVQGINLVDIDLDGWTDLYVCHDNAANKTFANNGSGVLSENASLMPSSSFSGNYASMWCDYDNDGDSDVYIAKCRLGVTDENDPRRINLLWRNEGSNGQFTEVGLLTRVNDGSQSWSADWADIDNDGDMDLFVLNHTGQNKMYLNVNFNSQFFFNDIAEDAGLTFPTIGGDWQSFFEDFDNDGFVDLLITGQNSQLLRNNGDRTFTPVPDAFPTSNNILNAAIGDLNKDGRRDIYATFSSWANSAQDSDKLYINEDNSGNNWIAIELTGTTSNINAIGARLELHGSWGKQIREVQGGEGYGIMNSMAQHFGIGTATSIDMLVIKWPSGSSTTITNPTINQFLNVRECGDTAVLVAGADDFHGGESEVIKANVSINANNSIGPGANISYRAGTVNLLPLFEAQQNSLFEAALGNCDE